MSSQFHKTCQQIAVKFLHLARGDLAFDAAGDVIESGSSQKLLLIHWSLEHDYHWLVTRDGATWMLENLAGGAWNVRQEAALEVIASQVGF